MKDGWETQMPAAGKGWQREAGMELELTQVVRRVSRSLEGEAIWCPTQPDFTSEDVLDALQILL